MAAIENLRSQVLTADEWKLIQLNRLHATYMPQRSALTNEGYKLEADAQRTRKLAIDKAEATFLSEKNAFSAELNTRSAALEQRYDAEKRAIEEQYSLLKAEELLSDRAK